ncbi:MAG TPA: ankyrin repeat domain-containing protein, partial [bacterium]|nr:ankyrin repeat domain-containing protein [bacterium]
DRGAPVDEIAWDELTPLFYAVEKGDAKVAKVLLEKGADINARAWNGASILHNAVKKGDTLLVRFLLDKGADVNARDKHGWTPLHWANFYMSIDAAAVLKKYGGRI